MSSINTSSHKELVEKELLLIATIFMVAGFVSYFLTLDMRIDEILQMPGLAKVCKLTLILAPVVVFFSAKHFSKIILFERRENLPLLVRFLKSKRFWFVVLLISIGFVLPIALFSTGKILRIIYSLLLVDFLTLLIATAWLSLAHVNDTIPVDNR
jgi:hypothetical protein